MSTAVYLILIAVTTVTISDACDPDCRDTISNCESFATSCTDSFIMISCEVTCKRCLPCVTSAPSDENGDIEHLDAKIDLVFSHFNRKIGEIESQMVTRIKGLSTADGSRSVDIVKGSPENLFDSDDSTCVTFAYGGGDEKNRWFWFEFPRSHVEYFAITVKSSVNKKGSESTRFHIALYENRQIPCGDLNGAQVNFQMSKCDANVAASKAYIWLNEFKQLEVCSLELHGTKA